MYKFGDKKLWLNGYLLTIDINNIFTQLEALTRNNDLLIGDFNKVINRIKGHFAFVFCWCGNVFASVDKIRSIPIRTFN